MESNSDKCSQPAPGSSQNNSPRKCIVSFSFNFDGDVVDGDNTTDSETANLKIDVAEIDDENVAPSVKFNKDDHELPPDEFHQARKRRRVMEEALAINEMEEEIERQLDAKAAKTNLTATNVKNILKHVITNEHVLAMVQNSVYNTEEGSTFEPKLTRAKAKELAKAQPNIPWPMTPVKKIHTSSEVEALITEDLSEDSSDEEYSPEQDQQSEDDGDHLAGSDLESQPTTPLASTETQTTNEQPIHESNVHYDAEGVFKIPTAPQSSTEEESIGQRTRSKLSLSETPLEQIEQAFIPPDITTDMYDFDYDMDEEWNNFLKEFTQPLIHEPNAEDDPEADPEYNILEDRETDVLDKEELRADKAVKVSRRELNDLVAELFEFEDMFSKGQITVEDELDQQRKKKSADCLNTSSQNYSINNTMINLVPVLSEPELPKIVSTEQQNIISIQFRQHIQLMTQHFAMTYMHPELHSHSKTCKDNLNSISILCNGEHSAFNVLNLPDALSLVDEWEEKLQDNKFRQEYTNYWDFELSQAQHKSEMKLQHVPTFHPELVKIFAQSRALVYPELLPQGPFRSELQITPKGPYLKSEEYLLAIGFEQFLPFHESQKRKFRTRQTLLMDAAQSIQEFLMPTRIATGLINHMKRKRASKADNPIKFYFTFGYVPARIHCIALENELISPKERPRESLPIAWQEMLNEKKGLLGNKIKSRQMEIIKSLSEFPNSIVVDSTLTSPIINMLPSMPNLDQTPLKTSTEPTQSTTVVTPTPQLRQRTPRLAKIRSAQNMRLMTQVSGAKSLSGPASKSRSKGDTTKATEESAKAGDNEDEIAELMLASTTIKKDIVNRKKARQARELENVKRLLEASASLGQEERTTKFAASCIQKVHITLESRDPELLRKVVKLLSNYSEKLEKSESEEQDTMAIQFYNDVCNALKDYPDLCTDFLLFLKPYQAASIGKAAEYTMLQKMTEFISVAQIYFAKQPSRMGKLMQALNQMASDPSPTLESVHAVMDPVLKGHPIVMNLFLQILPNGKPPESLFFAHLFENLICPVGPYDKNKVYNDNSPELYETIELSTAQEDNYGGDNCKCLCHSNNPGIKINNADHCTSCGVRYLNGRIYLQTAEGLRPAKVTFPGTEEEKQENMARVSLKTGERPCPGIPAAGRRRKSLKNDEKIEEAKQTAKNSPTKEQEEVSFKARRGGKSPPKYPEQRRPSKSSESTLSGQSIGDSSPIKNKREKRRRETKADSKKASENSSTIHEMSVSAAENSNTKVENSDSDFMMGQLTELESGKSDSNITAESENAKRPPWSREDDALLLQHVQKNYSEETFTVVSKLLGNRTVDQVKERCNVLLSLLQKMM